MAHRLVWVATALLASSCVVALAWGQPIRAMAGSAAAMAGSGATIRASAAVTGTLYLPAIGSGAAATAVPTPAVGTIRDLAAANSGPTRLASSTFLTATVPGDNGSVNYVWALGDGATATGAAVAHTYAAVGRYTAAVTATNGVDQAVASTQVTVVDQSISGLQMIRSGAAQPILAAITFTATTATGSNVNYSWSLGDGSTAAGSSTTHSHAVADKYRVIVTATNSVSSMAVYTDILYAGWTEREIRIPAGSFQMGCDSSNSAETCVNNEQPLHAVTLDAYFIDKYEVTNARYQACVAAGGCTAPGSVDSTTRSPYYGTSTYADYPVIQVNWHQASAFCAWAGRRLPTEAEWEKAARGSSDTRTYPWGSSVPDCVKLNYRPASGACVGDTSRVGSYPSGMSPYGVLDMAGNVHEWVNDWYDGSYYSVSPGSNPQGPATGEHRVLRGGSWSFNDNGVRSAFRYGGYPDNRISLVGFRCVRSQ